MYKRCEKPAPNTTISLYGYGSPCDVYQNMLNRIDALRRLKSQWPKCDISRFDVQFQLSDAMTYYFTIFDKANGERYEWSVRKLYTKESPESAFERDYNESALRYNLGVRRALDDHLESLQELNPTAFYSLEETQSGYRTWRPITGAIGVVPFEVSFVNTPGPFVLVEPDPNALEYLSYIPGESGRAITRMVSRLIKLGVVFDKAERIIVKDYRKIVLSGTARSNEQTHTAITIVLQEVAMTDTDLSQYHEIYTS